MTARKTWKATERRVANLVGGRRVPVTGRARGEVPDVEHPRLSIEVKHWSQMPARVIQALEQAEAARREGQLAIAVIHGAGEDLKRALVVMRLSEFVKWFCQ